MNESRVSNRRNNTSGFRGVSWWKVRQKWRASIRVNEDTLYLGSFDSKIDAAVVYDQAAIRYHGKHAQLNFPENVDLSTLADVPILIRSKEHGGQKERTCLMCGKVTKMDRFQRFCNSQECRKKIRRLCTTDFDYFCGV